MNNLSFPRRIQVSENVLFQELEGECVLLDMASEQYFGLDDVGTRIWQLLVEDGDTSKLLTRMRLIYNVTEERLRQDLVEFIDLLSSKGLIKTE